jgi:hypothetical protein
MICKNSISELISMVNPLTGSKVNMNFISSHTTRKAVLHVFFNNLVCLLLPVSMSLSPISAQQPQGIRDTIRLVLPDSSILATDSLIVDTLSVHQRNDKKNVLEAEVKYTSDDSLSISLGEQKIYLYKNADVDYTNINLKANYIEFDMNTNTVTANGTVDTTGKVVGKPVFTQGSEKFDSDTIRYNFESHKGIIKYIITKQGEGYLHSDRTKRLEDGEIHISKGKYTTCDAPHPHFYIRLTRAIAIPQKKIVSGPAYMVLEDIPLPLALPFGFFPNTENRSSGLIIPTYGEEQTRGFYLRNGGWYFAVNDYLDLTLLASVYSRGTWGITASSVYKVRYRFNGRFNLDFMNNQIKDDPTKVPSKDFRISWTHTQDPKANPSRKLSANVNFSTTSYEKNQSYNVNDYLTNTKTSSISYSKTWPGSPFNLTANIQQSQSSKTRVINMTLPNLTFNMNRIYPFRRKKSTGKYNWFENIQVSYASKLENRISAPDSTFFTQRTLDNMKNGFYHSIPISLTNIKLFKYINITPGISYNGIMYTSYIRKTPPADTAMYLSNALVTDTVHKITYAHSMTASLGISASPKIYGMFQSTNPNSYIEAIRHVMTPSVSFSFSPDMSQIMPNYYRTVATPRTITRDVKYQKYSIYENYIYGTPSVSGRSGSLSLSLNNNLEMKVRSKKDTTEGSKKVSILDNLNFSASYNPFASSYKWSTLNMTGSTRLFSQKLNVRFGATFNPYALDSAGRRIDRYLIREKGRLFRTTRGYLDIGFRLQSAAGDKKQRTAGSVPPEVPEEETNPTLAMLDESTGYYAGEYVDYSIPWSINMDYSWSFSKESLKASYTHTVRISGDISLTTKWKIGLNSGYDFISKRFTTTNISINRDLHCWEMRFSVVPFGDRRSYSFTINAKSSILRDVKYNKSRSWYDNF